MRAHLEWFRVAKYDVRRYGLAAVGDLMIDMTLEKGH